MKYKQGKSIIGFLIVILFFAIILGMSFLTFGGIQDSQTTNTATNMTAAAAIGILTGYQFILVPLIYLLIGFFMVVILMNIFKNTRNKT